MAEWLTLWLSD